MNNDERDELHRRVEQLEKALIALAQGQMIALDKDGRPMATDFSVLETAPRWLRTP